MANEELIYRITRAVYGRLGTAADEQTVEQLVTDIYREIEPNLRANGTPSLSIPDTSGSFASQSRGEGSSDRMIISVFGLDHPGIVQILTVDKAENIFFMVMEYVDGKNLAQLIQETPLTYKEAVDIVVQILAALQYAHERGSIIPGGA